MIKAIILLNLFIFSSWANAHQPVDGTIHATLGSFSYLTQELNHGFHSPVLSGPALIADGDLNKHGGLEVSLFYLRSIYSVRENGQQLTEQVKRIYVGMGYRHWFTRRFSLAEAFTSAYSMGDPRVIHNTFPAGSLPNTSARDVTEYGLETSVQFEPLIYRKASLILDARYNISLTNKHNEDANHYGVLVAIKYFVQSRERRVEPGDL